VEVLQGVRPTRFEGLLGRNEHCELSRRKRRTCWSVGGAVQVLADQPRDEGPERFREHLIGKLSSREPSTIKGPGRSHWSTCFERDHQSYRRSQPVLVDQVGRAKARWRALLLFAPSLLGWAVACDP
jgi:hypothetical protein